MTTDRYVLSEDTLPENDARRYMLCRLAELKLERLVTRRYGVDHPVAEGLTLRYNELRQIWNRMTDMVAEHGELPALLEFEEYTGGPEQDEQIRKYIESRRYYTRKSCWAI